MGMLNCIKKCSAHCQEISTSNLLDYTKKIVLFLDAKWPAIFKTD